MSLRHNFSWTFIGNVFYAAAQWGMLTVLAKIGTPEMVGKFALGFAITAPVMMFTNMNLQYVQATDTGTQYQFGDYLALRLTATTLALLIILGIVGVTDYRRTTALVVLLVGVAKAFESISDVFYGLLLQRERMDRIAKSMVLRGSLALLALGLAVYFTDSLVWGVVGLGLAWALVLFGFDLRSGALVLSRAAPHALSGSMIWKTRRAFLLLRPRWTIGTLRRLTLLSLPLGLVMALANLNLNIPRYFIEQYLGERELGIFAAMSYVTLAGMLMATAVGQAVTPRLAKYYAAHKRAEFHNLLLKLVIIGVVLGLVGVLASVVAGPEILTLLYGPQYAEDPGVFSLLMAAVAILFVALFLGAAMTAARYFRIQAPLFVLSVCTSAAICWWLVPTAGLEGAAVAVVIAALVQLFGSLAIVIRALHALSGKESV
jgi:O-antigen/teichoic acid export membrane protein